MNLFLKTLLFVPLQMTIVSAIFLGYSIVSAIFLEYSVVYDAIWFPKHFLIRLLTIGLEIHLIQYHHNHLLS